ncbi:MAG TPA: hypothetical protein DD735_06305 [Clostridiales bacterium]|nr:hypothetical protein [Clostridiales bacterium]
MGVKRVSLLALCTLILLLCACQEGATQPTTEPPSQTTEIPEATMTQTPFVVTREWPDAAFLYKDFIEKYVMSQKMENG